MATTVALAVAESYRALRQFVLARAAARLPNAALRVPQSVARRAARSQSAAGVDPYLITRLADLREEALICLYYDSSGAFRMVRTLSGDPAGVDFDRTALVRGALDHDVRYAVIAHNHPSGDAQPSVEDIDATRKVYQLLAALRITLVDHVVVARGGAAFSFRRSGLL